MNITLWFLIPAALITISIGVLTMWGSALKYAATNEKESVGFNLAIALAAGGLSGFFFQGFASVFGFI